jgi:hypothetical protein
MMDGIFGGPQGGNPLAAFAHVSEKTTPGFESVKIESAEVSIFTI